MRTGAGLGATLLVIAEFLPLLHAQSSGRAHLVGSGHDRLSPLLGAGDLAHTVRFLTTLPRQRFTNIRPVTFTERGGCPTAAPGPVRWAALAFLPLSGESITRCLAQLRQM